MKRFPDVVGSITALTLLLTLFSLPARADLAAEVNAILQDKLLRRATVGIQVYRLGATSADLAEILNLNGHVPFTPASNLKVVTTSAALDQLGPGFRFRTVLFRYDGDLFLIGDGDPASGDAEYLKKSGWKVTTVFENWAAQLKKMNIDSIRDVIVDDSIFDENFSHPLWPARQYTSRFEAEVGGMNLNANCVDLAIAPTSPGQPVTFTINPATSYVTIRNTCVTGKGNKIRFDRDVESNQITLAGQTPGRGTAEVSVTIHDPPLYAATVLSDTLIANGIKMTGGVKRDRTVREAREKAPANGNWQVIGIHETPIVAVLARCNKDSMNVYAESLCKRLGYESTHAAGSWASGTAVVGTFLKKAGAAETEFKLDDGSG
ncbi:MAG TPA: D-alanyl-D-alanine carboxypeptidase/D-alanyl-D-alanine-endopeptidase, partial [Humisphaera sp.]|nr:D-alanyl-D-alanine carboxypeptidase/D-alanyl-D-alanine-endopeptidase [Humisphaera sp.]